MRALLVLMLIVPAVSFGQDVKVNQTRSMQISPDDVKAVLGIGSSSLMLSNGECGLSLTLTNGTIGVDQNVGSIGSPDEFDQVCPPTGTHAIPSLHIVKIINSCSQDDLPGLIQGCGRKNCAVVTWHNVTPLGESLWMHEYAHTRCLGHNDGAGLLMNSTLNDDQFDVSDSECSQIKKGCKDNQKFSEQVADIAAAKTVEEFVLRRYIHGLPFEKAKSYAPQDVAKVMPWLKPCGPEDNACKLCAKNECWANIVLLIGFAGASDQQSQEALENFLKLAVPDFNAAYQAKLAVPLALGYLIHRPSDTGKPNTVVESVDIARLKILQLLGAGTHFQKWKTFGAKLGPGGLDDEGAMELAKQSILGLGVSGIREADEALHQLSLCSDPNQSDGCDEFLRKSSTQNLIKYGRNLNTQQQQPKNTR